MKDIVSLFEPFDGRIENLLHLLYPLIILRLVDHFKVALNCLREMLCFVFIEYVPN